MKGCKRFVAFIILAMVFVAGCTEDSNTKPSPSKQQYPNETSTVTLQGQSENWKATVDATVDKGQFVKRTQITPLQKLDASTLTCKTKFDNEKYGESSFTISNPDELTSKNPIGNKDFSQSGTTENVTQEEVKKEVTSASVEVQWTYQGETKRETIIVK
ncbi:hypothetical protein JQN58_08340 [Aneurinibacillus sp. BA2021]|nr:hypothetical protein [Aneurinibacillus sp. BA2021]